MYAIVTTIAKPTDAISKLVQHLQRAGGTLVVLGDQKGPESYETPNTVFLPLHEQLEMPFSLAKLLPTNHYARKNLGYLYACNARAPLIYETDDDNAPNVHWQMREPQVQARVFEEAGWVNAYSFYTDEFLWPRGVPLDQIRRQTPLPNLHDLPIAPIDAPIQQGLADQAPDVDALWRLLMDRPFYFERGDSVWLPPGAWCPFNSQSTWWWPEAYPLMYLPSHCSFRMTDIWRGFIAQRCLWAMGKGLVFHPAEVDQDRNAHNLMRDFEAEICGYLGNARFAELLASLELGAGSEHVAANLLTCYEALVEAEYFPARELDLVAAWINDLTWCGRGVPQQETYTVKCSLVTTCLNERESLSRWRQDLEAQTRFPDEVVIVDAESTDGTREALLAWAADDPRINVHVRKSSVAQGRNLAIEYASHAVIVSTDMGVRLDAKWVEAMMRPFETRADVDVVMGNYEVDRNSIRSPASRAKFFIGGNGSPFVPDGQGGLCLKAGTVPGNRSVAYKKSVWKALGGLPGDLSYAADDAVFGRQILQAGYRLEMAADALVYWERPQALTSFWKEQYGYGRGDGEASIKTPIAFRWHVGGKCPAGLVPLLTGLRWVAKRGTVRGLIKAIKQLDWLACLYLIPLQFGEGYSVGRGYLAGNAYGREHCQACRHCLSNSAQ